MSRDCDPSIGPADVSQSLIIQKPDVFSPSFPWLPMTPTATSAATGSTSVSITFGKTASTLSPVFVLVQGVNKLFYKKQFAAAAVAASTTVNLTVDPGAAGQLFFTVASAGSDDPTGIVNLSATVNGSPATVNVRQMDPALSSVV